MSSRVSLVLLFHMYVTTRGSDGTATVDVFIVFFCFRTVLYCTVVDSFRRDETLRLDDRRNSNENNIEPLLSTTVLPLSTKWKDAKCRWWSSFDSCFFSGHAPLPELLKTAPCCGRSIDRSIRSGVALRGRRSLKGGRRRLSVLPCYRPPCFATKT